MNQMKHLAIWLKFMTIKIDDKEMAMPLLNRIPQIVGHSIETPEAPGNEDRFFIFELMISRLLQN